MTEAHKRILKPEMPMMSWILVTKHAEKEGRAQKSSVMKRKRFMEEHAAGERGGCEEAHAQEQEQELSFPPDTT